MDFEKIFHDLKNELLNRYKNATGKTFDLNSPKANELYEGHVISFDFGMDFNNVGLIAFTAFNRFNSRYPGSPNLYRDAMEYVASNSINIDENNINKLDVDESRSILIKYMDAGNKIAQGEIANSNIYKALRDYDVRKPVINVLFTVSDLTERVSRLEDSSIYGLCKYLHDSAKQNQESGSINAWANALNEIQEVRGYGLALASNFIKDLMLWWVSSDGKTLQEIRNDVIGNTNKPDIHVKRMLCLILQPQLFDELSNDNKNYNNFKESDTEHILSLCGESEWESYYYKKVSSLCDKAGICPLELDRVLYGLMSGNFSEFGEQVTINPPNLAELEIILKKPK